MLYRPPRDAAESCEVCVADNRSQTYAGKPRITKAKRKTDYTCVTFTPDFARFGMSGLDADTISLLKKRVFDIAGELAPHTLPP